MHIHVPPIMGGEGGGGGLHDIVKIFLYILISTITLHFTHKYIKNRLLHMDEQGIISNLNLHR